MANRDFHKVLCSYLCLAILTIEVCETLDETFANEIIKDTDGSVKVNHGQCAEIFMKSGEMQFVNSTFYLVLNVHKVITNQNTSIGRVLFISVSDKLYLWSFSKILFRHRYYDI